MSWNTKLFVYVVCIFFIAASYTMCVPFLPVYLLELGAPHDNIEFWSAAVFAVCFLIGGIMAPVWGKIADSKGQKAMALRSAIFLCITYALGGIVTTPLQLFFVRAFQGFSIGYLPVVLSMVSSESPTERLGKSLGYIQSAQLIGTVGGPLIGGILSNFYGYRASFLIASGMLAIVVLVTYFIPYHQHKQDDSKPKTTIFQDLKVCFSNRVTLEIFVLFFFFQMVMLGIIPLLSLFVAQLNGSYDNIAIYAGVAVSLPPLMGAITAGFWGSMGQKKGYYYSMALALIGAGALIMVESFSPSFTVLMILAAIHGLFLVGAIPSLNAALSIVTPKEFRGRAFGAMAMFGQFGCLFGPISGAVVATTFSIPMQYMISGSVLVLMGLYVSYRIYTGYAAKQEHHSNEHKDSNAPSAHEVADNHSTQADNQSSENEPLSEENKESAQQVKSS